MLPRRPAKCSACFYSLHAYQSGNQDSQGAFRWKIPFNVQTADGLPLAQKKVFDGSKEEAVWAYREWRLFCEEAKTLHQCNIDNKLYMSPVLADICEVLELSLYLGSYLFIIISSWGMIFYFCFKDYMEIGPLTYKGLFDLQDDQYVNSLKDESDGLSVASRHISEALSQSIVTGA